MNSAADFLIPASQWVLTASLLSAGLIAMIVLLQRTLKERLIPGWSCLLWGLVLVRLLVPWSPESRFSILPRLFPAGSGQPQPGLHEAIPSALGLQEAVSQAPFAPDRIWMLTWLAGGAACAAYTLWVSWRLARRMNRETVPVHDQDMLALFAECRTALDVRRPVVLVAGAEGTAPALYGLFKPRVLIPAALFTTLDGERLRHIMLHELAHAKRHDIALNWLMQLVLSMYWFNPVLWYAASRLRQDQEMASDALALNCLAPERRLHYGQTLIHMLEQASQPARPAGNVYLTGSARQLQRRIRMIKRHQTHSRFLSILTITGILLVSGCVLTDPKESGEPASTAPSVSPSTSPAASAPASSTAATAPASPSPSPAAETAGQTSAGTGSVTQPTAPTAAPSAAVAESAPVQLVPRAVPASEQSPAPQDVPPQPAPSAEAGATTPALVPQPEPSNSLVAEVPQIVQPAQAAEGEPLKLVPGP